MIDFSYLKCLVHIRSYVRTYIFNEIFGTYSYITPYVYFLMLFRRHTGDQKHDAADLFQIVGVPEVEKLCY